MRVYLDVCCFNRPFDDQGSDRVRMESEAVKGILHRISRGVWRGVAGPVVDLEMRQMLDVKRRAEVMLMAADMQERVQPEEAEHARAAALRRWGFGAVDAMHVACAEKAGVDVFLTTDDSLLKAAARMGRRQLKVRVANPLQWFEEVLRDEGADT
jgi:predicted nucleic acid-binding protein